MTDRAGARELLRRVLDGGAWTSWDAPPARPPDLSSPYGRDLAAARERSGCDEAVLTGEGLLRGRRVAFVVSEFRFLAGSIGLATADRIVAAVERATAERLPLLAAPCSGGTRMQEGTAAFVQMARITAAVMAHRTAGLPYLAYLRHPTTGGVFASWGSLGHVTAAEPGALIGFLGPRVYEGLRGEPFPPGVQVAENLAAKGLLDAVVGVDDLAEVASRVLNVLCEPASGSRRPAGDRRARRDGVGLDRAFPQVRPAGRPRTAASRGVRCHPALGHRTGRGGPGPAARAGPVRCGAVRPGGPGPAQPARGPPLGPAGLRAARRGMRLAAELRLPLVTVVDTPGADLSADAEEGGLAGEIARCLADLITLPAPTLCLLLGEGTGGAALALLPADRVLAARHAWLSPLPPEGASLIVHRTPDRAAEMAAAHGVRAADLLREGLADALVDERPDAADEPGPFCRRAAAAVEAGLSGLAPTGPGARRARYRRTP